MELEWVEADAEALPFGDDAFDVVTSSFGAIFAPSHQAVADELVRVWRPGGTIGMLNFTPEGLAAGFFATFAPYAPAPPAGALQPVMWGSEEHLRALFGDRVASLEMTRRVYVESAASPRDYRELFKSTFGPVVAIYASLADQPARQAAPTSCNSPSARSAVRPKVPPNTRTSTCSSSLARQAVSGRARRSARPRRHPA